MPQPDCNDPSNPRIDLEHQATGTRLERISLNRPPASPDLVGKMHNQRNPGNNSGISSTRKTIHFLVIILFTLLLYSNG